MDEVRIVWYDCLIKQGAAELTGNHDRGGK